MIIVQILLDILALAIVPVGAMVIFWYAVRLIRWGFKRHPWTTALVWGLLGVAVLGAGLFGEWIAPGCCTGLRFFPH